MRRVVSRETEPAGSPFFYDVCERRCDQCLFSADRIVSGKRAADVIEQCRARADERDFECHKASIAGVRVVCRGFYDAYPGNSAAAQIADRLGLVRFVPIPGEKE